MLYDVIIIGGGPAGCSAAVYCARKQLKTLLITESFGGQSVVSDDIQNWIGEAHIPGAELAKKLEAHVRDYKDMVTVVLGALVEQVSLVDCARDNHTCDFTVHTNKGETYTAKSVILGSGARRRKLGVPGEAEFNGKGVAYCSTCDAPLFKGKDVIVVGGGNAGLEAVMDLVPYANTIYLLDRGDVLRGDKVTQEKIATHDQVQIMMNREVIEIMGDKLVTGAKIKNNKTNEESEMSVGGVFIEIGSVPNSEMVKDVCEINNHGEVVVKDFKHAYTSQPGIFAAGDVTDDPYKQNNISSGDGVRAALACHAYLKNRDKVTPADA